MPINLLKNNGFLHWEEEEIEIRDFMIRIFSSSVGRFLKSTNPKWDIRRVEAPTISPIEFISSSYLPEELWGISTDLVLRPETTASTYRYMTHILNNHSKTSLPFCVWQAGKSYRKEQNQPISKMKLKEFWQMEFQCAYSADSKNDYHSAALEPVRNMIEKVIKLPARIIQSDRLPSYSTLTTDIEVLFNKNWMEVCSISLRNDFPKQKVLPERGISVLEIAIGLDRCVYNWGKSNGNLEKELKDEHV